VCRCAPISIAHHFNSHFKCLMLVEWRSVTGTPLRNEVLITPETFKLNLLVFKTCQVCLVSGFIEFSFFIHK